MKRATPVIAIIAFCLACSQASAIWFFTNHGAWPKDWPAEMESLRTQSRTYTGSVANLTFHRIPFTSRDQFESAWPQILKVRGNGVPITLFKSPHAFLGTMKAGVHIWHPHYQDRSIWLVVDGDIVDLNRIELPPETQIIDRRFEDKSHP